MGLSGDGRYYFEASVSIEGDEARIALDESEGDLAEEITEIELVGTNTWARESILNLVDRLDLQRVEYVSGTVSLSIDPNGDGYSHEICASFQGCVIGYLPGFLSTGFSESSTQRDVPFQLFLGLEKGKVRSRAWVWLAESTPQWTFSQADRPPVTLAQQASKEEKDARIEKERRLGEGGLGAARVLAGQVDGVHYLETPARIKQLKRDGLLEEALDVCYLAIEGAEREARFERRRIVPPFYTDQAAIILRKLGRLEEEERVLERYIEFFYPPDGREDLGSARAVCSSRPASRDGVLCVLAQDLQALVEIRQSRRVDQIDVDGPAFAPATSQIRRLRTLRQSRK